MNSVELLGYYGSDQTHALSAWTSTSRELTDEKTERIPKLLKFLAEEGHHTPFEKSYFHFLVECDTASHIHLLKHRIGVSVNGESARYKELKEDRWHTPSDWPEYLQRNFDADMKWLYQRYHNTVKSLEANGISRKRAKESARYYLPYANQLTLDVSFNFRSFMHFQGLRNKEDAQSEIQEIADKMLSIVRDLDEFNNSLTAFGY
jgi:flavin-dependent thymidylate synthase